MPGSMKLGLLTEFFMNPYTTY